MLTCWSYLFPCLHRPSICIFFSITRTTFQSSHHCDNVNSVRDTGEDSYENSFKWVTLTFGSLLLPVLISFSSFKFLLIHIRWKHGTQPQEASSHLETDLPNTPFIHLFLIYPKTSVGKPCLEHFRNPLIYIFYPFNYFLFNFSLLFSPTCKSDISLSCVSMK